MTNCSWEFPYPSQRMPVFAKNVVATSQPLAAQAGLRMLLKGGNAVDAALVQALKDPKVSKTLLEQGAEPNGSTPDVHDKFNRAEIQKWIKVARAAGIQPN